MSFQQFLLSISKTQFPIMWKSSSVRGAVLQLRFQCNDKLLRFVRPLGALRLRPEATSSPSVLSSLRPIQITGWCCMRSNVLLVQKLWMCHDMTRILMGSFWIGDYNECEMSNRYTGTWYTKFDLRKVERGTMIDFLFYSSIVTFNIQG